MDETVARHFELFSAFLFRRKDTFFNECGSYFDKFRVNQVQHVYSHAPNRGASHENRTRPAEMM